MKKKFNRSKFKPTSIFKALEWQFELELNIYREFVNTVSNDINLKISEIEKEFDKIEENEQQYEYELILADEYWKYKQMFSKFTYNPMLLFLYGFLEHWFKRLYRFTERQRSLNRDLVDLAGGDYIKTYKEYFEKEIGIPLNSAEWTKIEILQQIRNLIAHHDSNLFQKNPNKNYNPKIREFLENEQTINFDEQHGDFYIKQKQFILETIDLVEKSLKGLVEKLLETKDIN